MAIGPAPPELRDATPAGYMPPAEDADAGSQRSLFGEILDWMLAPLLLLWPMSIALTYLVAQSIANQPFDHGLEDNVMALAQQVRQADGQPQRRLPGSARAILRADDIDSVYYQILAADGRLIDGDRELPAPPPEADKGRHGAVQFRNDTLHGAPIRIAFAYVAPERDGDAELPLVQVAETLDKRAQLANAIIKGVILPQFIVLPVVLALVWFALARGLSPLAQLQERIRARPSDDLSPIDARQVPEEIAPLVRSLNEMLARLAQSIEMQKRFIADAAHQMKTPLAGMRTQSELALRQTDRSEIHRSLEQLATSSEAATRLVNQLLTLARAEHQPQAGNPAVPLDLAALARGVVHDWVPLSFTHQIDLGFEAPDEALTLSGQPLMLRELLSNLIDNALRYTPAGGSVTVRVRASDGRAILEVEDSGPGIAPAEREHVFGRFYRILGSGAAGSGLGLAIVREIARQHGAEVDIFHNPRAHQPNWPGSLFRVTFPPDGREPPRSGRPPDAQR